MKLTGRLAQAGISVNAVTAYYHDLLFVPWGTIGICHGYPQRIEFLPLSLKSGGWISTLHKSWASEQRGIVFGDKNMYYYDSVN
jgi:hypothetical protein